jgi:hypothetical protein
VSDKLSNEDNQLQLSAVNYRTSLERLAKCATMNTLTIRTNPASPAVLAKRAQAMDKIEDMCRSQVQWYETDTVAEYRRQRAEGDGFPKPWLYEGARTVTIPGRDGHELQLRVIQANPSTKGVLLHFHAGVCVFLVSFPTKLSTSDP